jgi:hypothetical protein
VGTFDHPDAPSQHHIQYFETNGNRGIYKDGWWAGNLLRSSWDRIGSPGYEANKLLDSKTHPWELYNLNMDYSQAHNLADQNPKKLEEMIALFDSEAKRNQVYPLLPLRELISRPEDKRTTFVLRDGVNRLSDTMNPRTGAGTGYSIRAEIDNVMGTSEGVILAQGGRYGGFTLFVKDRHVHFEINSSGHRSGQVVSKEVLPAGKSTIVVDVVPVHAQGKRENNDGAPFPAKGKMVINGGEAVETDFVNVPAGGGYWSAAETLDVGSDLGSAVSADYSTPYRFTGKIDTVTLQLHSGSQPTAAEKAARNDGHS